jgi:hypothetical protein
MLSVLRFVAGSHLKQN